MRDEVSAVYALFGKFYVGLRLPAAELTKALYTHGIKHEAGPPPGFSLDPF